MVARLFSPVLLFVLALCVLTPGAQAQTEFLPRARVIVKFKAGSELVAKQAAVGGPKHARELTKRLRITMTDGVAVGERSQVILAEGISSRELAELLAAQPDVEYAEPDVLLRRNSAPNDPYYRNGVPGKGPEAGQWYLHAPDATMVSAIDIEKAWTVTTGSTSVVVAVLDTGVRYDHPDLLAIAAGGKLLPGYNMISDPDMANNGVGRSADASDLGDWVTLTEATDPRNVFYGCLPEPSSWHGTMVSGLIGAKTNNEVGMAGAAPSLRILPVRVLGKCGGSLADIAAGMRWAVGITVPGAPPNPNPAKVLNMSLGAEGTCPATLRDTVAEVTARGAVVVVSAGNSIGHAVGMPANCPGAIAVAGLRHAGTKVGYSDLGPEVTVAAPGGNCVNTGADDPCLYSMLTTTNSGSTTPAASTYTDATVRAVGTSFAAPLVAATAGLMLSANYTLTPADVRRVLRETARPFRTSGAESEDSPSIKACTAPRYDTAGDPIDQFQCYCTTSTCGAGMLNAGAAVLAVGNAAPMPQGPSSEVVEYYWAERDHYFITADPDEIELLDSGAIPEFGRTGYSFRAYREPSAGASPVCRFYLPAFYGDSHYFSASPEECDEVKVRFPYFILETSTAFFIGLPSGLGACPAGTTAVYRLWNQREDTNHRYITNRAARDQMVARGFVAEGYGPDPVAMCAPVQ